MKPTPLSILTIKATPLPRWLVVGNSAIVIGLLAALTGAMIGVVAVAWHQCTVLAWLVLLPLPLAVGRLQYVAGFRQNLGAAKAITKIHCCASAFFGFLSLWVALAFFQQYSVVGFLYFTLSTSLYCGFCGWMNLRVWNYLRTATEAGDLPDATNGLGRYQFTLRELMGVIAFVAIAASVAGSIIRATGTMSQVGSSGSRTGVTESQEVYQK